MEQRQLPTLSELHNENPDAWKQDRFKTLVNQPPPASWLKKHPMAPVQYLPIEKIEYLLDRICGQWRVDIKTIAPLFNSVVAVIRLHYYNPATNEWDFHDGTGAMPVQTDAGKAASDLAAIKNNAIQLAAPAAVSYAIKDAAEHIGALFGRNVSRKEALEFNPAFKEDPYKGEKPEVIDTPKIPAPAPAPTVVTPPPAPVVVTPEIKVDAAAPKFEADFFAPVEGDTAPPVDLDAPIDF
jgi:hypothetical protein